jgi:hypothetical protein
VNEKAQLRRMAKLGVTDFETAEDVERMQKDMLRRLAGSSADPDHYAGLANCRLDYCGRVNCLEACCFGSCRRRLAAIPAIYDLLQKCNTPLFEVRIGRGVWVRPFGKLQEASIEAARQLSRRALDTLYDYRIVAVGTFKVAPAVPPLDHDERWRCEIHQIVSGVKKEDLERIFSTRRDRGEVRSTAGKLLNHLRVTELDKLGPTISEVLRLDLRGWRHPWQDELDPARPTKAQRQEFYGWLLGLDPDARIIRYGCDQYFRKLEKKPRPIRAKVRKTRPYPSWLAPFWFGSRTREGMDLDEKERRACHAGYRPETAPVGRTVTDREEIRKWMMDEKPGSKRRRGRNL